MLTVKPVPEQNLNVDNDFINDVSSFSDLQVLNPLMIIHGLVPHRPNPALCALHPSVYQFPQQNVAQLLDIWEQSKTFY